MNHMSRSVAQMAIIAASFTLSGLASAASFLAIPQTSGSQFVTVGGISNDGGTIVGESGPFAGGRLAFRWTSGGGTVAIGDLPGGLNRSIGRAVSADGAVVVGQGASAATQEEAFRWTSATGFTGLGDLPGGAVSSDAYGVSADGSVVVGRSSSTSDVNGNGFQASRWTSATGLVGLGYLPGGPTTGGFAFSEARGVSADGSVVVGWGSASLNLASPDRQAFRWTSAGGMVGLGDLPGGILNSIGNGVSADGSVVVGRGTSAAGTEAFRWTAGTGMIGLGDLPGGSFNSVANAVSADGNLVVGDGVTGSGSFEAFLWTNGVGMQRLFDVLVAGGATGLTGWTLSSANAISADGRWVAGVGINPLGQLQAYRAELAVIPVPAAAWLFASALGLLGGARRRRPTA